MVQLGRVHGISPRRHRYGDEDGEKQSRGLGPERCSRGLEGQTPKQDELRQERKNLMMLSVLTEQLEKDLDDYETCSQAISAAYSLCNRSCVYEAERQGVLDAIEALIFLEMP